MTWKSSENGMFATFTPLASHFQPAPLPPLPAYRQVGHAPPGSLYPGRPDRTIPPADQPDHEKLKQESLVPSVPHFILSNAPLCQLAAALPTADNVIQLARRATPPGTRMSRLSGPSGESLICFRSLYSAPHNRCRVSSCGKRPKKRQSALPLLPVLHIDLSCGPWKSKPEAFWQPIVLWIQLPSVSLVHVQYSVFLIFDGRKAVCHLKSYLWDNLLNLAPFLSERYLIA